MNSFTSNHTALDLYCRWSLSYRSPLLLNNVCERAESITARWPSAMIYERTCAKVAIFLLTLLKSVSRSANGQIDIRTRTLFIASPRKYALINVIERAIIDAARRPQNFSASRKKRERTRRSFFGFLSRIAIRNADNVTNVTSPQPFLGIDYRFRPITVITVLFIKRPVSCETIFALYWRKKHRFLWFPWTHS